MNRTNPSPGASRDSKGHGLAEVKRKTPTAFNGASILSHILFILYHHKRKLQIKHHEARCL